MLPSGDCATMYVDQGCQNFLGPKYQNRGKYTRLTKNIPNGHKIFPMAIKYFQWP
jgi:hypothetical protein